MNRVIALLLVSDIFLLGGFGLTAPIMAIFIKDDLAGGSIYAAGLASMLFLLTKSFVQLPFSLYVDKHPRSAKWLIVGTLLTSLVPFIYVYAKDIGQIYVAQVIYGIGGGLAYPTWLGIWSTHLDKGRESFEWSLYSTLTGLGAAAAAGIGAVLAELVGFTGTFLLVGVLGILGCGTLLFLEGEITKKKAFSK